VFNVGSVQGYLKLDTSGWTRSMGSASNSLTQLSAKIRKTGMLVTASIGGIMHEFGKFDKAIRSATAVSETTTAQFKEMSDMALKASVKWNIAASETAQAFYYLGSAGLTVTEQLAAFNDTVVLSRAMGSKLSTTVEGLVDIVRAFGLEFEDVGTIAGQITQTIISSNQHFEDLDKAMAYAASTAEMTNNTFAETAAMLGIMANAGIKGSMAGTVLRRAMANLMAPMGAMRGLIYELGLELYDSEGKMKSFNDIIGQISDSLEGTSDEYRNLVFRTLFGVRALAGQIRLFDVGAEGISEYTKAIVENGKAHEKVAKKQMKAFTEQMGRIWRQAQKLAIVLGEQLAPGMILVADKFVELGKDLEEYIKQNTAAVASAMKWATLAGVLALAIPLLISVASSLLSLITPFTLVMGALYAFRTIWGDMFKKNGELSSALDEFTDVMGTWLREKFGVFGKAMMMAVSGWGMILGKSAAGWKMILGESAKGWDMINTEIDKAFGIAPKDPTGLGGVAGSGKKAAAAVGKGMLNQLKADMKGMADLVKDMMPEGVYENFEKTIATITEMVDLFMKGLAPAVEDVTEKIEVFNKKLGDIAPAAEKGKDLLASWGSALGELFRPSVEDIDKWQDKFVTMLKSIRDKWTTTFSDIMNDTSTKARTIKNTLVDMFDAILHSFNNLIAKIAANDLLYLLMGEKGKELGRSGKLPTLFDLVPSGALDFFKSPSSVTLPPIEPGAIPPGASHLAKTAVGAVEINVTNRGNPAELRVTGRRFDGQRLIINAVLSEINTNPAFAKTIRGG